MSRNFSDKAFYRVIDANINRSSEGLRVVEEFARFILNDRLLTAELKNARHKLVVVVSQLQVEKSRLIQERNSLGDVGRDILVNETHRSNYLDIVFANMSRVKESIRVLEEFSKLINKKTALNLKKIRYGVYGTEKKIIKKIATLRNIR